MFRIVKKYASKMKWENVFLIMTKDPRWEKVAGQIKEELGFCLEAQIPPEVVCDLMGLNLKDPDILKNVYFKRLVSYSVVFSFREPSNLHDKPVLTILKLAQTDTNTLIERLKKQATGVKVAQTWELEIHMVLNVYSPNDDILNKAWLDYISMIDDQPLGWNLATCIRTIYSGLEMEKAIGQALSQPIPVLRMGGHELSASNEKTKSKCDKLIKSQSVENLRTFHFSTNGQK
ncbi:uncharacterized protein PHALS_07078 [Plasmopara halstedii]|uniref:Uncharacterized protein n=1 Tax=Plasmopara halstedii TaxID=4781 RepID=A0A0P1B4R1_PLAHL|nr:uncharacterized protein PHALS_07078 [Plasmopara halstedii]CEG49308.1 hypothetical protein PHALS_07078 [Plasmopara halstedii]|eukprot:XP_024585677.1 hypothetical protein PHALS_07078 [Plasmopara halstedii]